MAREKKEQPVWADPPPRRGGKYDWDSIIETLRSKPGEWLKVFDEDNVSYPNAIRSGSIVKMRQQPIEVRTTNNQTGPDGARTCSMFLRWMEK